jgi:serine phosphatase RsbU (regulator of sigma subunit)
MNRLFAASNKGQRFASLFYAVLRPDGRFVYTNAGHNPPLVLSLRAGIRRLGTGGTVVGLFSDASYEQEEVEIESNDLIALFTDGVYEATSPDGSEFGEGRLIEILAPNQQQRCVELRDRVLHDARSFTGGSLADDATALVVRFLGGLRDGQPGRDGEPVSTRGPTPALKPVSERPMQRQAT